MGVDRRQRGGLPDAEGAHAAGQPEWFAPYLLDPTAPRLSAYFTYAFLHANFMHIIGNMLFLYVFGNNVNDKMGHFGYLGFYLSGGVFAGVAYVMGATNPILGASGAIAAVVGAYLILFPRSNITVLNFFLFIGWFEIASFWFIGFFFFEDLVLNFASQDGVAHMAHIGGTVFGCAVCITLLSLQLLPRDQFDVVAMVKQWNRRRVYRDAVSSGWNPYLSPGPPPPRGAYGGYGMHWGGGGQPPPPPPDPRTTRILELRAAVSDAVAAHDLPRAVELYLQLKADRPAAGAAPPGAARRGQPTRRPAALPPGGRGVRAVPQAVPQVRADRAGGADARPDLRPLPRASTTGPRDACSRRSPACTATASCRWRGPSWPGSSRSWRRRRGPRGEGRSGVVRAWGGGEVGRWGGGEVGRWGGGEVGRVGFRGAEGFRRTAPTAAFRLRL